MLAAWAIGCWPDKESAFCVFGKQVRQTLVAHQFPALIAGSIQRVGDQSFN
jgi:hypothetical protein